MYKVYEFFIELLHVFHYQTNEKAKYYAINQEWNYFIVKSQITAKYMFSYNVE